MRPPTLHAIEHFWAGAGVKPPAPGDPLPRAHWRWRRSHRADGEPLVWWQGKLRRAERVAYQLYHNLPDLAPRDQVRRTCEIKDCINPAHHTLVVASTPEWLDDKAFRLQLDNAFLNTDENFCTAGHTLKKGQKRKDCAACRSERRRQQKKGGAAELRAAPQIDPEEMSDFLIDLPLDIMVGSGT